MIEIDTETPGDWIVCDSPVYAGRSVDLAVSNRHGPVEIEVLVGGTTILSHRCPDPPCHQSLDLDRRWGRQQMTVVVRDSSLRSQSWSSELGEIVGDFGAGGTGRGEIY